jgi:hypothetical protein
MLRGAVFEAGRAGLPIPKVEVVLPALQRSAFTNDSGVFAIAGVAPNTTYGVILRKLGYLPVVARLSPAQVADATPQLHMETLPSVLPSVLTIGAPSGAGKLTEFAERRAANSGGTFFSRDDLTRHETASLADLLRRVAGVRIRRTRAGTSIAESSRLTRLHGRSVKSCPLQLLMDGVRLFAPAEGTTDDPPDVDAIPVRAVESLEVYSGAATTPAKFNGLGASCGTVVIWTRQ